VTDIQVTARLKIHPGKLEEFKAFADGAIQAVREKDTGTRQYDWFLSADGTECVVRERYASSEAVFEHLDHVGAQLAAVPDVADLSLELYGEPSPELLKALEAFNPAVFSFFGGLQD